MIELDATETTCVRVVMLKNIPRLFMKYAAGADTFLTLATAGAIHGRKPEVGSFVIVELRQSWLCVFRGSWSLVECS